MNKQKSDRECQTHPTPLTPPLKISGSSSSAYLRPSKSSTFVEICIPTACKVEQVHRVLLGISTCWSFPGPGRCPAPAQPSFVLYVFVLFSMCVCRVNPTNLQNYSRSFYPLSPARLVCDALWSPKNKFSLLNSPKSKFSRIQKVTKD